MKNFCLIVFALLIVGAMHRQTAAQKVQPGDITEIILETGDGFCRDCGCVTTLRADGTAAYHGERESRHRPGDYTGAIEKSEFARLAQTIARAGFFDFKPRYKGTFHDVASVVITVVYAGGSKTVENFGRSDEPQFKIVEQAFNAADGKIEWQKTGTKTENQSTVKAGVPAAQTKPVILILGTYHFANPGRDISNSKADDVLTEKRQREIVELITLLKKFKPTRIAVEQPTTNAKVNERYNAYLNGRLELRANESDQVGFRLAKDLNHKQIFTVDWQGTFDMDKVIKSAAANNQTAITDGVINTFKGFGAKYDVIMKRATIAEILRSMNEQEEVDELHRAYLATIRVGGADDYAGADLARDWYERNLKIYANILRMTESKDERVLVLIGGSHVKLLQQFAVESGDFELESASEYLKATQN